MTRRHFFLIALVPVVLFAAWHYLSPGRQLKVAQERFLTAVSEKDAEACGRLLGENYTDQWGFSPADWPGILKDLRMLSPVLEVVAVNPVFDPDNGVVETSLQVRSAGGPASEYIGSRAVELRETTRFTWARKDWRPWSWRLLNIQNPELEIPSDYQPGRITGVPSF